MLAALKPRLPSTASHHDCSTTAARVGGGAAAAAAAPHPPLARTLLISGHPVGLGGAGPLLLLLLLLLLAGGHHITRLIITGVTTPANFSFEQDSQIAVSSCEKKAEVSRYRQAVLLLHSLHWDFPFCFGVVKVFRGL